MAILSDNECLRRLRKLWADAYRVYHNEVEDAVVLKWAHRPEHWAEHAIRSWGWSYLAAEAVVRNCRSFRTRAARAVAAKAMAATTGEDAFDPLMPTAPAREGSA